MISYSQILNLWHEEGVIHMPYGRLADHLEFDTSALAPQAAMPAEVPVLFTSASDAAIKTFSVVEVEVGERFSAKLVVLGSVPRDRSLLYCIDSASGAVLLFGMDGPTLEAVNSSHLLWVEFLYKFQKFAQQHSGRASRVAWAGQLRDELELMDRVAFADSESWWSTVFAQLEGRIVAGTGYCG